MNDFVTKVITQHLTTSSLLTSQPVAGGCINNSFKIGTTQGTYFLKWNQLSLYEMFLAEQKGLRILQDKSHIHVPKVVGYGELDDRAYLLIKWIEKGVPSSNFWKNFGTNLALQHKVTATLYGLDHDNFIGSLKQSNRQHEYWADFFIQERLMPQVELAQSNKSLDFKTSKKFDLLFDKLPDIVPEEAPSLLHGDLWSGNFMVMDTGEATYFDPAVYFGHREAELAFTQLFGGFNQAFYSHYNDVYPLSPGFDERADIHNLYPLLVHLNLFGTSYLSGIISTLNRFT